jgi:hypothetical protein
MGPLDPDSAWLGDDRVLPAVTAAARLGLFGQERREAEVFLRIRFPVEAASNS